MVSASSSVRIGVIGLGSRGLAILERIMTLSRRLPDQLIEITVFEPNQPGVGLHGMEQPDYLLLNTIARQLSVFPDKEAIGSEDQHIGPDFYTWCVARNIMIGKDGLPCKSGGRMVAPTDFLPRRLMGEYLAWAYDTITRQLPRNVRLHFRCERIARITVAPDHADYTLHGDLGAIGQVERLFVTMGHTGRQPDHALPGMARIVDPVYPLPKSVEHIEADAQVGVEGFGLVAMDTLAALTLGRGGRFLRGTNGACAYVASGREPRIVLYSRSGLPFRVRPDMTGSWRRHQAIFLTLETIGQLRRKYVDGRLDFDADVFPLILLEMRAAYYFAHLRTGGGSQCDTRLAALRSALVSAFASGDVEQVFAPLLAEFGAFDPMSHLVTAVPAGLDGASYAVWVRQFVEDDLAMMGKGLLGSPIKAALEVWRDLRDAIRNVVDHGGLTSESRRRFYELYAPLVNRTVAGPQKERHQDLIALLDAGIVTIAPGYGSAVEWQPQAEKFQVTLNRSNADVLELDWIIKARIASSGIFGTDSPVLADLHRAGLLRPVALDLDSVEIDVDSHPIDRFGQSVRNLWVFGPVVEGATYYNHYIPSSGTYSRALSDAHRAVAECLGLTEAAIMLRRAVA